MTSRKTKSVPYKVGYGRPPLHTRFRKGRSGNPGGRPRRAAREGVKALALREAYRRITVKENGRALAMPAIQAIMRRQVGLAATGNVQAQRAVLAAIQTIEFENEFENVVDAVVADFEARHAALAAVQSTGQEIVPAAAASNTGSAMSYTEAARRIRALLRLDEKPGADAETKASGAPQSGNGERPGAVSRAPGAEGRTP